MQKVNHRLNGQANNTTATVQKGGAAKKPKAKKWTPKADQLPENKPDTIPVFSS